MGPADEEEYDPQDQMPQGDENPANLYAEEPQVEQDQAQDQEVDLPVNDEEVPEP